jgi:DNA-binding IclR family transcriptional regulator
MLPVPGLAKRKHTDNRLCLGWHAAEEHQRYEEREEILSLATNNKCKYCDSTRDHLVSVLDSDLLRSHRTWVIQFHLFLADHI